MRDVTGSVSSPLDEEVSDGILMRHPILLLDIDEVLFPWAESYRDFRKRRNLTPIPKVAWDSYTIGEATIPGHQDLMEEFHSDPIVLSTPPIPGRVEDTMQLARDFTLIACTSRYESTEGRGTTQWINRWVPWIEDVHFCNWHPELGKASNKAVVADSMDAIALIDDSPVHIENLPLSVTGLLVARPLGVPSAPTARPWKEIMSQLKCLHM